MCVYFVKAVDCLQLKNDVHTVSVQYTRVLCMCLFYIFKGHLKILAKEIYVFIFYYRWLNYHCGIHNCSRLLESRYNFNLKPNHL